MPNPPIGIVLLCGLPNSGKTTLCRQWATENTGRHILWVDTDWNGPLPPPLADRVAYLQISGIDAIVAAIENAEPGSVFVLDSIDSISDPKGRLSKSTMLRRIWRTAIEHGVTVIGTLTVRNAPGMMVSIPNPDPELFTADFSIGVCPR